MELIDIGGPTLVRAAAKNHAHVGIVTGPRPVRRRCWRSCGPAGALSDATRRQLARAAFAHTAAYDAAIVGWLDAMDPPRRRPAPDAAPGARARPGAALRREPPPARRPLPGDGRRAGRPGGPGSEAAEAGWAPESWWDGAIQHGGKELSYLNLYDAEAAWRLVHALGRPARCGRRQARQPLRRGGGRRPRDRLRQRPRRRPGLRLRRHRGGEPPARARRWPPRWPRCSPRWWWPRPTSPAALEALTAKKNLRVLEARPPSRAGPAGAQHRRWPAGPDARPGHVGPRRLPGRHPAGAERGGVGRPRAGLAGRGRGHLQHDRGGQGRRGVGDRRRPAEPPRLGAHRGGEGGRSGGRAGPARPTPSSRSGTASTPPPRPGAARSSSPAARSATTR